VSDWLASDQVIISTDAVSFAAMESARCTAAMSFDHDFAGRESGCGSHGGVLAVTRQAEGEALRHGLVSAEENAPPRSPCA
jgi:hypothetical protein